MEFKSIGTKDKLRIDIAYISSINNFVMAKSRLWIENKYIGDFNDVSPIGPLISTIRNLITKKSRKFMDDKISINKSKYFYLGDTISPGESFDDFNIKILKTKKNIHFIWRLNKYSTSDYTNYIKMDLHHGQVSISYFEEILSQFEISFKGQLNDINSEKLELSDAKIKLRTSDKFWNYFENNVKLLSEFDQRKVAFEFAQLARHKYDEVGLDALNILKLLTIKTVSKNKINDLTNKLRFELPLKRKVHPNSVLLNLLTEHSTSYPIWYSTGIAGNLLCELKVTTFSKLLKFTKDILERIKSESKN